MTPIASHITAFLRQRLVDERNASRNTCESYTYAFKLLFEFLQQIGSRCHRSSCVSNRSMRRLWSPSCSPEIQRNNGANSRNIRLAAIRQLMHFMQFRGFPRHLSRFSACWRSPRRRWKRSNQAPDGVRCRPS